MTKATTNLLLMLITIVASTFFYITCCSECGTTATTDQATEQVTIIEPEAIAYPFAIDGNGFSYSTNDNYNFNVSSHTILMPLSVELTKGITGLPNHLETNENNVVNITGFYASDEKNNTAFPNLGLARANTIKNDLASKGISTAQINTIGKLIDDMIAKDGTYWGAAVFDIEEESQTDNYNLKVLYEKINADSLILHFNTAEASINLDAAQRHKVADISRYFDKVDGATANVVGLTDNTGKASSTSMRLGQDRADFAKDYLMKNGIASDKIVAASKGQTEPITSNKTEEGRDKNRRTINTLN